MSRCRNLGTGAAAGAGALACGCGSGSGRAHGCGRSFGSLKANGLGDFVFERRARGRIQRQSDEAREDFERGSQSGGAGLSAEHRGQGVGWTAAGAGGDNIIDGLIQLVTGALNAFKIVA